MKLIVNINAIHIHLATLIGNRLVKFLTYPTSFLSAKQTRRNNVMVGKMNTLKISKTLKTSTNDI